MKKFIFLLVPIIFLGSKEQPENIKMAVEHKSIIIEGRESIYNEIVPNKNQYEAALIKEAANKIGTNPNYLSLVIKHESRFNTKAVNPYSNAVGLIQFMPQTLNWMGYNTNQVYNMTFAQQMLLVVQYYNPYIEYNLNHPIKLFLCTFYPYALRKWDNDNYVFGSERSKSFAREVARINKGFDLNKDGVINMNEYKLYHKNYICSHI